MTNKYKVSDLAKDFNMQSKEMTEIVKCYRCRKEIGSNTKRARNQCGFLLYNRRKFC